MITTNTHADLGHDDQKQKQILVVEDSPDIVHLIQLHLEDMNFCVDKAFDGKTGLEKGLSNHYDLIVLDLTLPHKDGLEICQILRQQGVDKPIMMLTARSEEMDHLTGLKVGANYYITKPFSINEFKIGVSILLEADVFRLSDLDRSQFECTIRQFEDLEIDTRTKEVRFRSELLDLEEKEYLLLAFLACHPGQVFSRSELLDKVWGYDVNTLRHTVTSYISRLRKKIEPDFQNPRYLLSAPGGGYKFNEGLKQAC